MAKRSSENEDNSFDDDIEPLLESDVSQEEKNDVLETSSEHDNHSKKCKSEDNKLSENIENPEANEVKGEKNSIEDVINDVDKSTEAETLLGQFTKDVASLYQTKLTEMLKMQKEEFENFKKEAMAKCQKEINKFEKKMKKLKLEENELMKALEEQLKILEKCSMDQRQSMKKFIKLHKSAVQEYQELNTRHTNQALDLKEKLNNEILELQNLFMEETEGEEITTFEEYLEDIISKN